MYANGISIICYATGNSGDINNDNNNNNNQQL